MGGKRERSTLDEGFLASLEAYRTILDAAFETKLRDLLIGASVGKTAFLASALSDGKKIRGCLTCVIGEALGASLESVVPRAVAIELIQAATLIHDDFIDQDRVRRARPAVWTVEGARRAVLVGDVIFAGAIAMMSEMSPEDGLAASRAIALVSAGALQEPLALVDLAALLGQAPTSRGLYEKIIHLKTGILFGAACELGAIAARAPADLRDAARRYGLRTGEAYQIADDLKEVRAYARARSARPEQMAAIAPALLCFAKESGPDILRFLEQGCVSLGDGMLDLLVAAQKPMEEEIKARLLCAASEIEGLFPANRASRLAKEAPWGTISLFNAS